MVISSDILLKGAEWKNGINSLSKIFTTRTNYSVFIISASIGIMYDKQIDSLSEDGEDPLYVPRNVLSQNRDELKFLYQTALITTSLVDFDEEKRLELAFGEENRDDIDPLKFLLKYANFGIIKLIDRIGVDDLESLENIKNFLTSTMEGTNFDIDSIDDELEDLKIAEEIDSSY